MRVERREHGHAHRPSKAVRRALFAFPRRWRDRYLDELLGLIDELQESGWGQPRLAFDVLKSGLQERFEALRRQDLKLRSLAGTLAALSTLIVVVFVVTPRIESPSPKGAALRNTVRSDSPNLRIVVTKGVARVGEQGKNGCTITPSHLVDVSRASRTHSATQPVEMVLQGQCPAG